MLTVERYTKASQAKQLLIAKAKTNAVALRIIFKAESPATGRRELQLPSRKVEPVWYHRYIKVLKVAIAFALIEQEKLQARTRCYPRANKETQRRAHYCTGTLHQRGQRDEAVI